MLPTHAAVLLGQKSGPSLDLNFVNGSPLDSRIQFTRASSATYFDSTGTLQSAGNNVPRIDYGPNPTGRTNWLRNSTMQGTVAGTPGTPPSHWFIVPATGVSSSIVGTGTEDGLPYIDVRFNGTPAASGNCTVLFEAGTDVPALNGDVWTGSFYMKLVAGSLTNIGSLKQVLSEGDSSGTFVTGASFTLANPTSAGLSTQRQSSTRVFSGGSTVAHAQNSCNVAVTAGNAIDITLRIAAPQLERDWIASPWIPTSGSIVTVGAEPLGLLIEEQRTNSVRNPRCEGAVAGSPGTVPTDWVAGGGQSIIGSGVEMGIPFVDCRFNGAGSVSGFVMLFDAVTAIPAAAGQVWSGSFYAKLVGGSLSGFTSTEVTVRFYDSTSTFISQQIVPFTPTDAPLSSQRGTSINATAPANTAFVVLAFRFNTSAAYDLTIRFGGPQLEQGAFATSLILPPAGSPAAATRAADVATMALGSWWGGFPFTLLCEAEFPQLPSGGQIEGMAVIDSGTNNNRVTLRSLSPGIDAAYVKDGAATAETGKIDNPPINTMFRAVIAAYRDKLSTCVNGGGIESANGLPPDELTTLRIGQNGVGGNVPNGYIRRLRYWPRALPDIALQQITDPQSNDETLDLDFTLGNPLDGRIQFSRASAATYFDRTGTLQTAASNQPRIDYDPATGAVRGLLIEEQRTNSIRNPRAEGAVAGTPGTAPTNWAINPSSGVTSEIVGTGTEGGIPYIDVRFFGTSSLAWEVQCDTLHASASVGQTWTSSCFVRLIAGTVSNFTPRHVLYEFGTTLRNGSSIIDLSSASLKNGRSSVTYTLQVTDASNVQSRLNFAPTGAIDFTIRIGLPQLEQGAFPTSPVMPPAGSPAASTRAADAALMAVGQWFSDTASTLAVEAIHDSAHSEAVVVGSFNTTDNNRTSINISAGNAVAIYDTTGPINSGLGTEPISTPWKAAFSFEDGAQSGVLNGGTPTSLSVASLTHGMNVLYIGNQNAGQQYNGGIRRLRYWPRAMANSELQKVTS